MKIRKAVITAAGWGTRFLPVTRSQPKEMLPIVDKPLIQYSVEEALASGIEQIIMVTAMGKNAIEDYFDRSLELEYYLENKGETEMLRKMLEISSLTDICFIRQKEHLGLGHAILMAKDIIGDEPFAVILPDDIIAGGTPCLKQMIEVYDNYGANIIAVERVADEDVSKYGVIKPEEMEKGVYRISGLVEKPEPAKAPSRLGIVGRYILQPQIFDILKYTPQGVNGEVQLTDALGLMLEKHELFACEFEGSRFDAGSPMGWLKANVALALKRNDMFFEFRDYLKKVLSSNDTAC
jgi:UTP--glucose-1-phosphate uridylyltransferase